MIKHLRVTVDGKAYDVTVQISDDNGNPAPVPPLSAPLQPVPPAPVAPASPGSVTSVGPGDIPSPLSGRVTAIIARPGQEVKGGDHIITLEAMKMNTFVFSPHAGRIAEIKVAVGDAVNEGQAIARLD